MRLRIPLEFSVGILAALTLLLLLPPLNFPIFGIFVFWGGTFLLGSPNLEGVKKMVPPAILGTIFGVGTLLLFQFIDPIAGGSVPLVTLVNIVILFVVVTLLVYCARIPGFATIAAAFCSFAVFVATATGAWNGLAPHNLFNFWLAATLMCCAGPFFAWASVALTRPATAPTREKEIEAEASKD
jgi:uncharacterized protein DUF1097